MITKLYSSAVDGIEGHSIDIEIDVSEGLPNLVLVGLLDMAIKESRERIRSAVRSLGYQFPNRRVVVNLAPANLKKEGTLYDLPMALGLLHASEQVDLEGYEQCAIVGELSLDGQVRSVRGVLPMVLAARAKGLTKMMVPYDNRNEAAVVKDMAIFPVKTLSEALEFFQSKTEVPRFELNEVNEDERTVEGGIDFSDVKGQVFAKRALEIAAAGNHNVLMVGPPGSGKSMLAKRFETILPDMNFDESLECTKIHSVMGLLPKEGCVLRRRPFRAPHHSVSNIGLVGGGRLPQPGEITLAHHGVLFLDELPEFHRYVLEVLRQPLENKKVTISRAAGSMTFPANFILIAAMNPCPCGFLTHETKPCHCNTGQIQKYLARISGPLLDRIDMQIEVPAIAYQEMASNRSEETSESIRTRVVAIREMQEQRGVMADKRLLQTVQKAGQVILQSVMDDMGYSARAVSKLVRLSRTIADMEGEEHIDEHHILEAVQYRSMDRVMSFS